MHAVVVVGSLNIDHVVQAGRFPSPGQTVPGQAVTRAAGGKGANQAAAAARCAAATALVARVGTGAGTDDALAELRTAGVDVSAVARSADLETGSAWITVAGGENTIVVVPGANGRWPADDAVLAAVPGARVVLAQLEVPVGVVARAARLATGTVIVNAAPARSLPEELLARCDVLVVNEHELSALSTVPEGSPGWPVSAARAVLERGAGAVVATAGGAGAVLVTPDAVVHQAALRVEVVDTTGAGDALCGALAAALAEGASLPRALRLGVAAGSLAATTPTARFAFDRAAVDAAAQDLPAQT